LSSQSSIATILWVAIHKACVQSAMLASTFVDWHPCEWTMTSSVTQVKSTLCHLIWHSTHEQFAFSTMRLVFFLLLMMVVLYEIRSTTQLFNSSHPKNSFLQHAMNFQTNKLFVSQLRLQPWLLLSMEWWFTIST